MISYARNVELFPKRQILDISKLKEFADDNFKFNENGRKFSKWVENTVGKGEIAGYEQFLIFRQYFQKDFHCRHVKTRACLGNGKSNWYKEYFDLVIYCITL